MGEVDAVRAVEIFLVTGRNNDRHDVTCGGASEFGPYFFAPEDEEQVFLAAAKKYVTSLGKTDCISFRVTKGLLREPKNVFSGDSGLEAMRAFLGDARNW